MMPFCLGSLTCLSGFSRSRYNLSLGIFALRQQLGVLKRKNPRARLRMQDRIFWILLRRLWPAWSNVLVIVKPESVIVSSSSNTIDARSSISTSRTESTTLLRRRHRRCDLFLASRIHPRVWFHSNASVACITYRIGSRLPGRSLR